MISHRSVIYAQNKRIVSPITLRVKEGRKGGNKLEKRNRLDLGSNIPPPPPFPPNCKLGMKNNRICLVLSYDERGLQVVACVVKSIAKVQFITQVRVYISV